MSVSSAFLFGPLPETGIAETPYAPLTHIRVIDDKSELDDPFTLPRTLEFVEEVLLSNQYDFINLSLGPNLPIEDTDIHVWTSILDSTLSDGSTLMTVAAGNNGEHDQLSGNARIQVPADCVNALAVGAADCDSHEWKRASYSAFGPGRSPGFIKPDLVAFGGSDNNMFNTLDCEGLSETSGNMGTSFAAPYLLRSAVGIKASLGNSISILGTKALLIHCAERACYDSKEVGWGRAPSLLEELILCPETESRIIYQGILKPGKYLRFNIPLPKNFLDGPVKIRATVCITTQIDPQDTSSYTRAGVNVTFRPNSKNYAKNAKHQKSKPFFTNSDYSYEDDLRVSGKWETVLKAEKNFHSTSLYEPCFDVHYNAREYGGKSSSRDFISYALILSLITPKTPNLTQKIIEEYPVLTQIRPRIQIARIEA